MKRIRLTKARLRALHSALSLDDVLYEKFRRLNEELNRREQRLGRKSAIREVIQRRDNMNYVLQVDAVHSTEDGLVVFCR